MFCLSNQNSRGNQCAVKQDMTVYACLVCVLCVLCVRTCECVGHSGWVAGCVCVCVHVGVCVSMCVWVCPCVCVGVHTQVHVSIKHLVTT